MARRRISTTDAAPAPQQRRSRLHKAGLPTRAFAIASASASTLDPLVARLVLGRAELTEDRWRQGRERLTAAIEEARVRPELDAETYNAAVDLGRWLINEEQYEGALETWEVAMEKADAAAAGDSDFARAEARMGHAAALFVQAMVRTIDAGARPTDTRLAGVGDAFDLADLELVEAENVLGPHAHAPSPGGHLTSGQRMYATAMAWRAMLRAFVESRGLDTYARRQADFEVPSADLRPACLVSLVAEPRPRFPPGAQSAFASGAVVVRLKLDSSGAVIDNQVAAAIPDRWFRDAVARVAPQWRLETLPESEQNCRYYEIYFVPITFRYR